MAQDQQTYRRAAGAALIGLFTQLLLCAAMTLLGLWLDGQNLDDPTRAVTAAALHLLGGLPIWVLLWMVYNQHRLERAMDLEAQERVRQQEQRGGMFDEQDQDLNLARQRLTTFYKWSIPAVSLALAAYLLGTGLWLFLRNLRAFGPLTEPGWQTSDTAGPALIAVAASVFFVAFVVARYIAGMTSVPEWQRLRGGAGYLMGNALAAVLLLLGAIVHYWTGVAIDLLTLLLPLLMAVIGLEMALALVLGLYRPRRPGEWPRPAFESRLLGWLTSPESIARIISQTLNYQFGIEVSRSWFYQLLSRAITPLIIFGLAMLVLVSTVVVVQPQQQAVILRFGEPVGPPVGPGLHLQWPWPIGSAQRYDVGQVLQVSVGSVLAQRVEPDKAILWTNMHAGKEEYLLVAPTPLDLRGNDDQEGQKTKASGKVLVGAQIVVQYRVADLWNYIRSSRNPQEWFRALVERQASAYVVSKDIDTLLGEGRLVAGADLMRLIQKEADDHALGVDVLFVGVTGVHPPAEQDVAKAFLQQIGAGQGKQSRLEQARRKEIETLVAVAGSSDAARKIDRGIADLEARKQELEELKRQTPAAAPIDAAKMAEKEQQIKTLEAQVEDLMAKARGEAAQRIYEARAQRWTFATAERAAAERFSAELLAYRHAPDYYLARQYLEALAEGLPNARKYVVDWAGPVPPVWRMDFKDSATVLDLSDLPGR